MAEWCCDQEYEACTQVKDAINVCETVFASGNANVSIAEANAIESSSTSTTSSLTLKTLSSKANAGSTSITPATRPLDLDSVPPTTGSSQCLRISSIPCNHLLTYRGSRDLHTPTIGEPGHFRTLVGPLPRSHRRHRDQRRPRHRLRVSHSLDYHTRETKMDARGATNDQKYDSGDGRPSRKVGTRWDETGKGDARA